MHKNVINKLWHFGVRLLRLHYQSHLLSFSVIPKSTFVALWHLLQSPEECWGVWVPACKAQLGLLASSCQGCPSRYLLPFKIPFPSFFFCVSGLWLLIGDIHLQCDPKCCAKRLSRVPSGKTTVLQGVEKIHVSQASSSHALTLSAVGAVLMNQRKMKGKSTNMSLC